MHILLVNNYNFRNGISRFTASLANNMAARGHKVSIISQKPAKGLLRPLKLFLHKLAILSRPPARTTPLPLGRDDLGDMYALAPEINIIPYNFTDKNLKIQKLRKKIVELAPDVCVCPLPDGSQLVWAVTLLGSGVPYIYSEHHCPGTIENVFWTRKGRLAAMSGADAIHLLLPEYVDSLPDFLKGRACVIPNEATVPPQAAEPRGGAEKTLLWLGRLHDELKQCRLALDAFALVARDFPDWKMLVAGDGQDKALIMEHAASLGLGDRISFAGDVRDVWPVYGAAQAFCFSSRTEGMPIVLLEAMASGLPCAAFAHCDGVKSLLKDGETGLLAREMTAEAMADRLATLMGDADLREKLGAKARQAMSASTAKDIYDGWENMLLAAAQKKGSTAMDQFRAEPFASQARLSSCARREWLWRDFGKPIPYTFSDYAQRARLKIGSFIKQFFPAKENMQ